MAFKEFVSQSIATTPLSFTISHHFSGIVSVISSYFDLSTEPLSGTKKSLVSCLVSFLSLTFPIPIWTAFALTLLNSWFLKFD